MQNQKREDQLNLALETPEEEREKTEDLNVGFNPEDKTWQLIIRYSGTLDTVRAMGIEVIELLGGFAILTVPETLIPSLTELPEIEYIEKPKRLFFAVNQAKAASCINPLQTGDNRLSGKGTIVAVVDSGIDFYHEDFRNEDGSTRILELWDQTRGQVYTREEINQALEAGSRRAAMEALPSVDLSGHGTAVTGIAAGNGRGGDGRYRGVAYESDILVVKLGLPDTDSFPRTTELMTAVDFAVRRALHYQLPVAVNISFGNTYGSHQGNSLLETYMNSVSNYWKSAIVVGTGNEGSSGGHAAGVLEMGVVTDVEVSVAPYETGFSLQLWKNYADVFEISLIHPSGENVGPISPRTGPQRIQFSDTTVLFYYGEPSPYSRSQEIYMDFIPNNQYVGSGIWKVRLNPVRLVTGNYNLWLPSSGALNRSTRFLNPVPDLSLTIPSTAAKVISVGAYDDAYQTYADFSGRGSVADGIYMKPDLAAPGVGIITSKSGGGYEAFTGTSFATPFVTGSASLMMQWGIVEGNDPFLYGEKIKAYLIRGARQLPGFSVWPNPQLGYGVLCLSDSIPR